MSSLLGVAGGEPLIPALIFVFGTHIVAAGSASILLSLRLISVGLWHLWPIGGLPRGGGLQRITTAMSFGSIIGAGLGGSVVAFAPAESLKLLPGCVLVRAAAKKWLDRR